MNNTGLFAILIGGLLVNNFVLSQFLGICPFLGVSAESGGRNVARGDICHDDIDRGNIAGIPLSESPGLGYLQTVSFILVIAALSSLWR